MRDFNRLFHEMDNLFKGNDKLFEEVKVIFDKLAEQKEKKTHCFRKETAKRIRYTPIERIARKLGCVASQLNVLSEQLKEHSEASDTKGPCKQSIFGGYESDEEFCVVRDSRRLDGYIKDFVNDVHTVLLDKKLRRQPLIRLKLRSLLSVFFPIEDVNKLLNQTAKLQNPLLRVDSATTLQLRSYLEHNGDVFTDVAKSIRANLPNKDFYYETKLELDGNKNFYKIIVLTCVNNVIIPILSITFRDKRGEKCYPLVEWRNYADGLSRTKNSTFIDDETNGQIRCIIRDIYKRLADQRLIVQADRTREANHCDLELLSSDV